MDRRPAVAGIFYPSDPEELSSMLEHLFLEHEHGPKRKPEASDNTLAVVSPHAGYIYSGPCAAHSFVHVPKVDTVVLIGPNHTGLGHPISVRPDGKRHTPLGALEVDEEFVDLLTSDMYAQKDYAAHINEHCLEVQLPFLIYAYNELGRSLPKIVPIVLGYQQADVAITLGMKIKEIAEELGKRIYVIASSDLDHYEPQPIVVSKDMVVLKCVESLDIECLYKSVFELDISVCGYGAIATAIDYTKRNGGKAKVLKHMTSGDVTGDYDAVVGYGSVRFYR